MLCGVHRNFPGRSHARRRRSHLRAVRTPEAKLRNDLLEAWIKKESGNGLRENEQNKKDGGEQPEHGHETKPTRAAAAPLRSACRRSGPFRPSDPTRNCGEEEKEKARKMKDPRFASPTGPRHKRIVELHLTKPDDSGSEDSDPEAQIFTR